MKGIKILGVIILGGIIGFAGFIGLLTVMDFNPPKELDNEVSNNSDLLVSNVITVLTWNLGYSGLGSEADFFLDGGKGANPTNEAFEKNLTGIKAYIGQTDADLLLLQEVDIDSKRSFNTNVHDEMSNLLAEYSATHSLNYNVMYVPVPFPPMGKIKSGISTLSRFGIDESIRVGFNKNYSWPQKIIHLDRCISVNYLPVQDSNHELVLINVHLSAYDDGGLRSEQLGVLKEIMEEEYSKGNYVVAGGDFNQLFPTANNDLYPTLYPDLYTPELIEMDYLDDSWQFVFDDSYPTYRLLNEPYNEDTSQVGVIDGFIISPNIEVKEVKTEQLDFEFSDHNPVYTKLRLKK